MQQKALTAFSHGALTSSAEFSSLLEAYQSEAYTLGMLHGELIEGRFQ
ncbi:hypothetical protein [Nevskia sp.]|nr:hypothetical protein [Nevskia sp.]